MSDPPDNETPVDMAIRHIMALDPNAHVAFSIYTGQWYLSARIEVSDGKIVSTLSQHRDTPDQAVLAFFNTLVAVSSPSIVVTNGLRPERRNWRWNGACFVEVACTSTPSPDAEPRTVAVGRDATGGDVLPAPPVATIAQVTP